MSIDAGRFKRHVTDNIMYKWIKGIILIEDIIKNLKLLCQVSCKEGYQRADSTTEKEERLWVNHFTTFLTTHSLALMKSQMTTRRKVPDNL